MEAGLNLLTQLVTLCELAKGMIGYFRFPDQKLSWGGPFNGQQHRLRMFSELQKCFGFKTIVETGTFRGTTTEFFSTVPQAHTYTVEANPWSYGYCWARLRRNSKVSLMWGDSREQINRLAEKRDLPGPIFFYLDAHWEDDLPLRAELESILSNWSNAVVMVDDFEVEGDPEYGFDDYGNTKRLSIRYIKDILEKHSPALYFPSAEAQIETGARRGSVVLISRRLSDRTESFSTLRLYSLSPPSRDGKAASI